MLYVLQNVTHNDLYSFKRPAPWPKFSKLQGLEQGEHIINSPMSRPSVMFLMIPLTKQAEQDFEMKQTTCQSQEIKRRLRGARRIQEKVRNSSYSQRIHT